MKSLAGTTLVFEPGTRTKYSNAGIAVVGAVVERIGGKSFPMAIDRALLSPLGMTRSSFEPGQALVQQMAHGLMWTYDGQTVATPTFLLGTGPAGNLVSTVNDLGRFVSFLFAQGRGPGGAVIKAETLKSMLEPRPGKPGETPDFGLGFAISRLDGERTIGHNGAVYGFASEVKALPDQKLGAVVITSVDCANGIASHIATTALRLMLAARHGKALPKLEMSQPINPERARNLAGHYAHDADLIDVVDRNGKLLMGPLGGLTLEIRAMGNDLMVDDRLLAGPRLLAEGDGLRLGRALSSEKRPASPPPARPAGTV